ncbi:MAG: 16S rRNA (cytosine(1402)-N(4))-methyltransferase RsmH [Bdellovibrionales bacterium]|nr:16S rRNA (cytosine(1402)-N(4))-methyltransferase RsmH [Bdellovibrionales bacterium]
MTRHVPVLLRPTVDPLIEALRLHGGLEGWLIDCTFGGGGHTGALLEAMAGDPRLSSHRVLALDRDAEALERGRQRFGTEIKAGRLELAHSEFSEAAELAKGRRVLGIMADLGFSSDQLDTPTRGFSFLEDGPLDMRMNPSTGESARELLASLGERELADLIFEFGEERFSRRIARRIVEARSRGELPDSTASLAALVLSALPPPARHGRLHGATRTFQALRIAVNSEMAQLDALLDRVILALAPGGRMSVISFHSLEDRRVKLAFKRLAMGREGEAAFRLLTKKPVEADDAEAGGNPRSRSAKLRVIERLKA